MTVVESVVAPQKTALTRAKGAAAKSPSKAAAKGVVKATAQSKTKRAATPAKPTTKATTKSTKTTTKVAAKVKPITKTVARPAAKVAPPKTTKLKKPKMVRDSFTFPKDEYGVLESLKMRAAKLGSPAKKTELLRAGIKAIAAMHDAAFIATLKSVPSLKTGRPAKPKA